MSTSPNDEPPACGHQGCCGHDHDHDHDHTHGHDHAQEHEHKHGHGFLFYLELSVLILWGCTLIAFMVNGRVVNFLTGTGILREQTFIGGFVLLLMAAFNFINRNKSCDCGHDHSHGVEGEGEDGAAGHSHNHNHEEAGMGSRLVTLAMLALPVGYAWAKAPDGYSVEFETQMANSASAQMNTGRPSAARTVDDYKNGKMTIKDFRRLCGVAASGPIPMDAVTFFYNGADPDTRDILKNEPVEIVGRVVKNTIGNKSNRLRMFDLEVTCCSADARPFSFPLQFNTAPPEYIERGWYKVRGKAAFEEERGGVVSMVMVDEMTPTTRPTGQGAYR